MTFNQIDDLWLLSDTLTIPQAAALIAGIDPEYISYSESGGEPSIHPKVEMNADIIDTKRINIALKTIINSIQGGSLKAKFVFDCRPVEEGHYEALCDYAEIGKDLGLSHFAEDHEYYQNGCYIRKEPNWSKSYIKTENLRSWLNDKEITQNIFFQEKNESQAYLDKQNPRYSPKLAAAVRAWEAVTDPAGKHPKQALRIWLEANAMKFGVSNESGIPPEQALEEMSAVANWQGKGGAPKTPGK